MESIIHLQTLWQTKSLKSIRESSDNFLQRSARLLIAPMLANASSRNYKHQWKESGDIYQIELNNNQSNNGDNNNNDNN